MRKINQIQAYEVIRSGITGSSSLLIHIESLFQSLDTFSLKMSLQFSGKVIAITGAASGIGLALSRMHYARGASISIADRNAKDLLSAVASIGLGSNARIYSTTLDVCSAAAVDDWTSRTVKRFGSLSGAANLAGVMGAGLSWSSVDKLDDEDWKFVLDVNLTGTMHCLRAQMREMKKANIPASIVTTASIAGLTGFENNSAYVASKHSVVGLTSSAAKEVGPLGIRVNSIAPYASFVDLNSQKCR